MHLYLFFFFFTCIINYFTTFFSVQARNFLRVLLMTFVCYVLSLSFRDISQYDKLTICEYVWCKYACTIIFILTLYNFWCKTYQCVNLTMVAENEPLLPFRNSVIIIRFPCTFYLKENVLLVKIRRTWQKELINIQIIYQHEYASQDKY